MTGSDDFLDRRLPAVLGGRTAGPLDRKLGLRTVRDLLYHFPRTYLRRGEVSDIASLVEGETVTLLARIDTVMSRRMQRRKGWVTTVVLTDGVAQARAVVFSAQDAGKWLFPGTEAVVTGTVKRYQRQPELVGADIHLLDGRGPGAGAAVPFGSDQLLPIYPAAQKLTTWTIADSVATVLGEPGTVRELADPIPRDVRDRFGLLGLGTALDRVHRPRDHAQVAVAKKRFRFEEAFLLQTVLARRRVENTRFEAVARPYREGGLADALRARLPYALTPGQESVLATLRDELAGTRPVNRLLQGEVGSGKTVVALLAMLQVVDAGGQAALLAPTEVLAQQHYRKITDVLGPLAEAGRLGGDDAGTRVELLTGTLGAARRRDALLAAASGQAGIVIGTHALLGDKVQFADLGLVVVDEQHRFGVEQRDELRTRSLAPPHMLVMTATPIPRTVAMTVFGDLDVSTLRELPAGRQAITSHVVDLVRHPNWVGRIWQRVAEEVGAGRQVYVVCPRIGDGDEEAAPPAPSPDHLRLWGGPGLAATDAGGPGVPAVGAVDTFERLRGLPQLSGLRLALLHGALPTEEKEQVMARFAAGEIDVLVATTVVEVGVDVPRASMMVVLDAGRFGVSQLHQLRGRVGRGSTPGLCLLVTESESERTRERLDAVAATLDGFALAEYDVTSRREGDVLGSAQSGRASSLQNLRVMQDADTIERARGAATRIVDEDPDLERHPVLLREIRARYDEARQVFLERS